MGFSSPSAKMKDISSIGVGMKRRDQRRAEVSQGGCEPVNEGPQRERALLVLYLGA